MCAIVDADIAHQVFGSDRPEAGAKFFQWINTGNGRLVVGGKLLEELDKASKGFRQWAKDAQIAGRMKRENESRVNARVEKLRSERVYTSDDPHTVALAQVSGARLLYSNDKKLQRDFKNRNLIDNPRGSIYTTNKYICFHRSHKGLLGKKGLCQAQ